MNLLIAEQLSHNSAAGYQLIVCFNCSFNNQEAELINVELGYYRAARVSGVQYH
jgi:hypothetical protein